MTSAVRVDVASLLPRKAKIVFVWNVVFEINTDAPSLSGGLTSSRLCENNDSFQWPVASKIFLMCANMNKAGFRIVALPQIGCSALVSYETPVGAALIFQGTELSPVICLVVKSALS